jgi:hypothetical protein
LEDEAKLEDDARRVILFGKRAEEILTEEYTRDPVLASNAVAMGPEVLQKFQNAGIIATPAEYLGVLNGYHNFRNSLGTFELHYPYGDFRRVVRFHPRSSEARIEISNLNELDPLTGTMENLADLEMLMDVFQRSEMRAKIKTFAESHWSSWFSTADRRNFTESERLEFFEYLERESHALVEELGIPVNSITPGIFPLTDPEHLNIRPDLNRFWVNFQIRVQLPVPDVFDFFGTTYTNTEIISVIQYEILKGEDGSLSHTASPGLCGPLGMNVPHEALALLKAMKKVFRQERLSASSVSPPSL